MLIKSLWFHSITVVFGVHLNLKCQYFWSNKCCFKNLKLWILMNVILCWMKTKIYWFLCTLRFFYSFLRVFEVRLYFWFGSDNLFIDIKNDLNLNNEVSFSIINFIGLINLLLFDNNLMYQICLLFMEQIKTYKRSDIINLSRHEIRRTHKLEGDFWYTETSHQCQTYSLFFIPVFQN